MIDVVFLSKDQNKVIVHLLNGESHEFDYGAMGISQSDCLNLVYDTFKE